VLTECDVFGVQVCILIDPSQTLAEQNASDSSSSDGSKPAAAQRAATSSNGDTAPEPTTASDLDTKKLVQVTVSHTFFNSRDVQLGLWWCFPACWQLPQCNECA
jgi:hypothetical protein